MTVQRIDPERLHPTVRAVNRGLFGMFVAAGNRANPHRSVMLYNGDGFFRFACRRRRLRRAVRARLYEQTTVRYWSRGI